MIPSNLTLDEALKFYDLPQPVLDAIERERQVWQDNAAEQTSQREEILEEQIGFAQSLIDAVEESADNHTVMREFRKHLQTLLSDSMFER